MFSLANIIELHIPQRSTLPNIDWDFSGFPESCDNITYMEDDEKHKCFAILHWEMWWAMTHLCLKRLISTFTPSTITNSHAHCGLFQNSWIIFSHLFGLCPNFLGVCCSHQNQNLFFGKRFFVLLSANKRLNRMNKSQILRKFYKMSQLFMIWCWISSLLCIDIFEVILIKLRIKFSGRVDVKHTVY